MKNKKLFVTLMLAIALMLALAISSYAATVTVYSGADNTSEATTYTGSLTLTGNTEENDTVTVYYTDDGRAWKAGETVSFTEDTNLYTIECTKISSASDFSSSAGGNNYILMNDIEDNSNYISGTNCTTRLFMNGKAIILKNKYLFGGSNHSFYLLGEGDISSLWGKNIYTGACSNATDVVWLIGKDVTVHSNKDNGAFFLIYNHLSPASLNIHVYGEIALSTTQAAGTWSFLYVYYYSKADYNIYFHESSSVELTKEIVRYGGSGADTGLGNIYFEGGDVTLSCSDYFFYTPESATFNGTLDISGGTFNITNADTLSAFKAAVVDTKKAQDVDETTFKVICKECAYEKTLGDDFVDLTETFSINMYCPNCNSTGESVVLEGGIFSASGYSLNAEGTAICGGYTVNSDNLAIYKDAFGSVKYGIVIANADSFEGKSFLDENGKVNSSKAIQVEIDSQYSNFSCSINFGTTTNDTLNLVICAYVIGEDGVSFIQHTTGDSVSSSKIADGIFKSITLDMIVTANQPVETKENI